jgi:glucose/arabinose dehydrogenase
MRERSARRSCCALAVALCLAAVAPAAAEPPGPVLPGFEDVSVASAVAAPTAVRFAPMPDGRILVAEKSGVVLAFDRERDPDPDVLVDLRDEVHDFWDRGMLGMALDPGFATNHRLYLLYTRDAGIGETPPRWSDDCPTPPGATEDGCVVSARLVRVTLGTLGEPPVVEPLIEQEWCQQFPGHSIGTVAFGPDGMLYAGAGDGAMWGLPDYGQHGYPAANPCADPDGEGGSLRSQDARTDGDPAGLDGAIVRVDPQTGEAAPGNPFSAAADPGKRRIVAFGMRNPFRFTFRPGSSELWIGDVGNETSEEIDRVDVGRATAPNLGWPCFEGADRVEAFADRALCASLPDAEVTMPRFTYRHYEGAAAVGEDCDPSPGSSLSGIAFLGDSSDYPAELDGALFFADYSRNCVWVARAAGDGQPDFTTTRVFARGGAGGGVIDLQAGPGGDLVYAYYDPWDATNSEIRRIRYSPANSPPVARVEADPPYGPLDLHVRFSADGSSDADGDALDYAWDLDGDGAFDDATGPTAEHTYTERALVTVRVQVRDQLAEDVAEVRVGAGDTPPVASFDAPAAGAPWAAHAPIELRASATDAEGDAVTFAWTVTLQHCGHSGGCHAHPLQQLTGAEAAVDGPEHEYPSHLVVRLTATDALGLSDVVVRELHPAAVSVSVATDPRGLAASLATPGGSAPSQTVIAGSNAILTAPSPQTLGDREFLLAGWDDGDGASPRLVRLTADHAFVARFEPVAPRPPPPPPPPAADTTAPALRLSGARRQRLTDGRLRLRAGCPAEACRLVVRPLLRIGRRASGTAVSTRQLRRGETATIAVRLTAAQRRAVARALDAGRRVTVRLRATAADAAGNATARRLTVELRPG